MRTFEEWLVENDPQLEEKWQNWLAGAALAASLARGYHSFQSAPSKPQSQPAAIQQMDQMDVTISGNEAVAVGYGGNFKLARQDAQMKIMQKLGTHKISLYGGEIVEHGQDQRGMWVKYKCYLTQPEHLRQIQQDME